MRGGTHHARANRVGNCGGRASRHQWLVGIPSSFSAEFMAHLGWDSLVVDMQHGMIDYQDDGDDAARHFNHGDGAAGPGAVERPGAYPEGARRRRLRHHLPDDQQPRRVPRDSSALAAMRRSAIAARGRSAPSLYGGADYHAKANDIVIAFGMIETAEAIAKLDEILSTRVSTRSMSARRICRFPRPPAGRDKPDEWMMTGAEKGARRLQAGMASSPASIAARPAYAKKMIEMGFMFVTVGGDTRFVTMGGQAAVLRRCASDAPSKPATGSSSPY